MESSSIRTPRPAAARALFRLALLSALAIGPGLAAAETAPPAGSRWPAWRGPDAAGAAASGMYPIRWSASEGLAWKIELPGIGRSTPVVWDDHIIITGPIGGEDGIIDLDREGKVLWRKTFGKERPGKHRNASGSNPSPVTDGQRIYSYWKSGGLAALDFSGEVLWRTNLQERFGPDTLWWDVGTSPVLAGKHVVLAVQHSGSSYLAAFDRADGRLAWKVDRNFECALEGDQSYSTPLAIDHRGKEAVLVWGAEHLTAHDAGDGSMIWSCGGFNPERKKNWVTVSSPVIAGDLAIVPYGRGARLAGIALGGTGDVTATHRRWTVEEKGSFVPTPAARDGTVYVLRDRGEVLAVDSRTSESRWTLELPRHQSSYYASPTVAGGRLYAAREDGTIFVVGIEGKPEVLAENGMDETVIASPVPLDGRLLIRGEKHLFCIAGR